MQIEKARESLQAAEMCFGERLYNSTANRAYYAMYQAAVVALERTGYRPRGETWSHEGVQSTFATELTRRSKRYPAALAQHLSDGLFLRNRADYTEISLSQVQARRILRWAQEFIEALERA
ncbi:MAG: HEPN domain-containing protein [Chloroflexi bacterium]|nr:HEPN domain-containing protein [Chloroflexota bacterium]